MKDEERSRRLAECVDKIHARRASGETPDLRDFMGEPDEVLQDLAAVLDAEAAFDDVIEPRSGPRFPRPFGSHTLTAELGRGAIGMVYAAVHRPSGRHVALKVLRTGFDTDPAARERFRREAAACAAVRHPNIVAIHEVDELDGEAWYSMDLVEGPTLHAAARAGALPRGAALAACFADAADALHALHTAGIVHRDVKPANIVVAKGDAGPRFVLADFGLARDTKAGTADRLTSPGALVGTPLYMSPEQVVGSGDGDPRGGARTQGARIDGARIDGRSDVYSLGATMYEVIAGRPMLEAGDPVTLLNRIVDQRPPHLAEVLREKNDGADADTIAALCDVVMKAVEKRQGDRYASAAALRDDLRAVAAGRPPSGRPITETRHRLRRARGFAGPAALVVASAGAFLYWTANRPATLAIRSVPPGEVLVNGTSRGTTPLSLELAPGDHDVGLRLDGFAPRTERITLAPGEVRDVRQVLVVADPDDPDALRKLAAAIDVAFPTFSDPARVRGSGGGGVAGAPSLVPPPGGVLTLFPRGAVSLDDVAADDVATLRLECDDAFRGGGTLVFRRGGATLHEEPFAAPRLDAAIPLPPAVRAALRPGDTIEWGWRPAGAATSADVAKSAVLATFTIDASPAPVASRLADIDARLADQPPAARRLLRAVALLAADRPALAHAEAAAVAAAAVAANRPASAAALQLAQESLIRCGLADTRLAIRTSHALDAALAARAAR